jgi:segregation and condensation protein A
LVEYKKFKDAAVQLHEREALMDTIYERRPGRPEFTQEQVATRETMSVFDLVNAVAGILRRYTDRTDVREIQADPYTVSEKIDLLRQMSVDRPRFRFGELFATARSRAEVVVTFLALLELIRLKHFVAVQAEDFGEIDIEVAPAPVAPGSEAAAGPTPTEVPDEGAPSMPEPSLPPADIIEPVAPPEPGTMSDATPTAKERPQTA